MTEVRLLIDEQELTEVVGRWVGSREAVGAWRCESVAPAGVASSTGGVWRVCSMDDGWSVILKVVRHSAEGHRYWLSSADPSDSMYWKREALVLASDLFDGIGGRLRPPRLLGAFEGPGDCMRLWLEDVSGAAGVGWDASRYRRAAVHLGELQGRFVAGVPLPRDAWLSRGWLRAYVERRRAALSVPPPREAWRHPLVKLAFPDDLSDSVARLWAERDHTLDTLDRLPQTLCHQDFWPPNLFQRSRAGGDVETVAIDWAYTGIGAFGEDLATLMAHSLRGFFLSATEHARSLTEAIFEGYLEGLAHAGAAVDRRVVRYAFCAAASLKYVWGFSELLFLAIDEEDQAWVRSCHQDGLEHYYVERGAIQRHLLNLADEARGLAESI